MVFTRLMTLSLFCCSVIFFAFDTNAEESRQYTDDFQVLIQSEYELMLLSEKHFGFEKTVELFNRIKPNQDYTYLDFKNGFEENSMIADIISEKVERYTKEQLVEALKKSIIKTTALSEVFLKKYQDSKNESERLTDYDVQDLKRFIQILKEIKI